MVMETPGLNLVRTVDRITAAHVITEHRAGLATGQLARLRQGPGGVQRVAMESQDETAAPDGGGRLLRYPLADLEDGVYAAESVGAAGAARVTYFEVWGGSVRRIFERERQALQELRRRAG